MPTRANRDTNSYGMNVDNGARAPHTEIEDRFCLNIKGNYLDSYSLFVSLVAVVAGHRTSPSVHVQSSTHHLIKRRRRSNNI